MDLVHLSDELHRATTECALVNDDCARLDVEAASLKRSLDDKLVHQDDLV